MLTVEKLAAALKCPVNRAVLWVDALNAAMAMHAIDTPKRQSAFLAQLAHESANLQVMAENLNYTPEAILRTFNTSRVERFTPEMAERYGRTPQHPADQKMIASIAYGNRMGNGPAETSEGWLYRGRGPIQITGKNNFRRCGGEIGVDLLARPELLEKPGAGAMSAAWYWTYGNGILNLNIAADEGEFDRISDVINLGRMTAKRGDANGYADRLAKTEHIYTVLA